MTETNSGLLARAVSPLSRTDAVLVASGSALVTAGTLQVRQLLTVALGPLVVGPVPAVIAIAGLLFGPVAVVGSTLGYLGYQALQGFVPLWAAAGYLVLGLLLWLFWQTLATGDHPNRPRVDSVSGLWRFAFAAALGALSAAALVTWGYEVTGRVPFFPTVLFQGLAWTLSVGLVGGTVLTVAPRLLGARRWQSAIDSFGSQRRYPGPHRSSWIALTGTLLFAWVTVGSAISISFQLVELVPPFHIRLRGLDPLLLLKSSGPLGNGRAPLQLGLGVTVITLWLASLRRWGIVGGGDDDRN